MTPALESRELPPSRPKVNPVELANRSIAMREQRVDKRDGLGFPVVEKRTKSAVRYMI